MAPRLTIRKTHKLFIGGRFPRSESGRYLTVMNPSQPGESTQLCHASRKDLREAVGAARKALPAWSGASAHLRGQILYRAAEMLESRAAAVTAEALVAAGTDPEPARAEVNTAVDRLVYYAGWTDKLPQAFGTVNPVASPHFNFTLPEPTGVVVLFAPAAPPLLAAVDLIASVLAAGSTCVAVVPAAAGLVAAPLGEVLATSDLPAGAVNLLTALPAELAPWAAGHMDVNAILDASAEPDLKTVLATGASHNLKRVHHIHRSPAEWFDERCKNPSTILAALEYKTAWHPTGV